MSSAQLYALHPEAYSNIDAIREFISDYSLDAADRVVTESFDSIRTLVPFPDQDYRRPNLTSRPLWFKQVRKYVIA